MKHLRDSYNRIQDPAVVGGSRFTGIKPITHDEPVFLIRAKDMIGPVVVRGWADAYIVAGGDRLLADKVKLWADKMQSWQEQNGCKLADLNEGEGTAVDHIFQALYGTKTQQPKQPMFVGVNMASASDESSFINGEGPEIVSGGYDKPAEENNGQMMITVTIMGNTDQASDFWKKCMQGQVVEGHMEETFVPPSDEQLRMFSTDAKAPRLRAHRPGDPECDCPRCLARINEGHNFGSPRQG